MSHKKQHQTTTQRKIADQDKKVMVQHFKRGRRIEAMCEKFPKYTRYQIGAIRQHVTKGDY